MGTQAGCNAQHLTWSTEVKFMPQKNLFDSNKCASKHQADNPGQVPTVTVAVDRSRCAEHLVRKGVMRRPKMLQKGYRRAAHFGTCKSGLPLGHPSRLGATSGHEQCATKCDRTQDCTSYAFNSLTTACMLYSGRCEVIQRTHKNYVPYVKVQYNGAYFDEITRRTYTPMSLPCVAFATMLISGKPSPHQQEEGGHKIGIMVDLKSKFLQPAHGTPKYLQPIYRGSCAMPASIGKFGDTRSGGLNHVGHRGMGNLPAAAFDRPVTFKYKYVLGYCSAKGKGTGPVLSIMIGGKKVWNRAINVAAGEDYPYDRGVCGGDPKKYSPIQSSSMVIPKGAGGEVKLSWVVKDRNIHIVGDSFKCSPKSAGPMQAGLSPKPFKLQIFKVKVHRPTQTNRWCNGQKTSAGMTNPTGKTPAACIALCKAVPACGWFGFRRNDRHCEFWTPDSCAKGGHVQAGHDIYKVLPGTAAKKKAAGPPAQCLAGPRGWKRPYGDVSISKAGAESCKEKCKKGGYAYFGLECPMRTKVHCQCSASLGGTKKDLSFCRGQGKPLHHAHAHCVGPYQKDGFLFGDYGVGSAYPTAASPGTAAKKKAAGELKIEKITSSSASCDGCKSGSGCDPRGPNRLIKPCDAKSCMTTWKCGGSCDADVLTVNGNGQGMWCSRGGSAESSGGQWLDLDLGSNKMITSIQLWSGWSKKTLPAKAANSHRRYCW